MSERFPAIRVTMLPKDTNAYGTIFGGVILSYIDLAGGIECRRRSPKKFVTKAMHEVVFVAPVHLEISLPSTLERFVSATHPSQLALKLRWNVSAWVARRKSSGSRKPKSFMSRSETTENQFPSNHEKACLHH